MARLRRFGPPVLPGLALALFIGLACRAEERAAQPVPATRAAEPSVYATTRPSSDGIGKVYMGREIAQVMGHLGAGWLERPDREREEQPTKAIELMALKPTDVVADIGAGTGYFSFRIAKKVPKGKVLAVDIQKQMLDIMNRIAKREGVMNVEPVLGTIEDPNLPEAGVDLALMVDAYHEFDHPREMMVAIVKALKPGGRVVDIEYRGEDPDVEIKPHHKMTEAQAIKEMTAVGLRHVKTFNDLPQQHLMIFKKPEKTGGDSNSDEKALPRRSEGTK
jgi:ubiquinone/menaquinone biosynthesis C-methylase UbiE